MSTSNLQFASLQEAMKWISEKYTFNAKNYKALPGGASPSQEWKKVNFAANHCLVHIVKSSFPDMLSISWSVKSDTTLERLKIALLKAGVNLVTIANQVHLSGSSMAFVLEDIRSKRNTSTDDSVLQLDLFEAIGRIAGYFEQRDHKGPGEKIADRDVAEAFALTVIIYQKFFKGTPEDFYSLLPTVMISK